MDTVMFIVGSLIITSINGWVTWYFTYEKKKGENRAMKEDIQELTTTTEQIKNDLHLITQNQIGIKVETRNAVMHYNEAISNSVENLFVSVWKLNSEQAFVEFMTVQIPKILESEARLNLFITDTNPQVTKLSDELLNLITQRAIKNISEIAEFDKIKHTPDIQDELVKKVQTYINDLSKGLAPIIEKRGELNKELFKLIS